MNIARPTERTLHRNDTRMQAMTRLASLWLCASAMLAGGAQAQPLGTASGTGSMPAIAEARADLPGHTVYHPVNLPDAALPLFVWGNGACRNNGLAYAAFLRQVASAGYFVVAVGVPRTAAGRDPDPPQPAAPTGAPAANPDLRTPDETSVSQLLEAIDWAGMVTGDPDDAFFGRIDVTRIAVGGHSCGGLQALAISADPRIDTTLVLASGIYNRPGTGRSGVQIDKSQLARLHAPALYLLGGPEDIAYPNGTDDVARLDHIPVFLGSLPVGHGGTFFSAPDGGEWALVSSRWLDWHLKNDPDAAADFSGDGCRLCTDSRWTVTARNLPPPGDR